MGISIDGNVRQKLIFGSLLLMLVSLFTSRWLLSAGMISFLLFTCIHKNFGSQFKKFISNFFLLGLAILFLVPLISGWWSSDQHEWLRYVRIKLPLLLLPLGFAGRWQLSSSQWKTVALCFCFLTVCGAAWSLTEYLQARQEIDEAYLKAKSIPTLLGNDHIRFSLLVTVAIFCLAKLLFIVRAAWLRISCGVAMVFLIVYLHVLSARTGLLAFYILAGLTLLYLIFNSIQKKWLPLALLILAGLPLAAWYSLPTFRNRMAYINYDLSNAWRNQYMPGGNDGNRVLSIRAGWGILNENPAGVGIGDVKAAAYRWYAEHVPNMLASDRLLPSSEWLIYGNTAGWFGFVLFTLCMLAPFFEKLGRDRFFWLSLNTITAFSLAFDIGLEVQYGVFIHAFIVLWWWKWIRSENNVELSNELSILDNHHLQKRRA